MARILYLHGSGHTGESFAYQALEFAGSEALALPGHPVGEPLGTVAELATWMASVIAARSSGPAVICGNSLGSAIALQTALRFPEQVAGLILIGAGARLRVGNPIFEMIDTNWPACIDELVALSVDDGCSHELRQRVKDMHLVVGPRSTRADYAACNAFDVMDRVRTIAVPTLIIVGSNDRMTPPKYATFLNEAITGSELVVVDRSGHLPHLEKPNIVNDAIRVRIGATR